MKHKDEFVGRIINSVLTGIRTEEELIKCGCPSCNRALQLLHGDNELIKKD